MVKKPAVKTADVIAERIKPALQGVNLTSLAAACGVTRQAVDGWKRTGRIDKRHLQTIAKFTGRPVEHFLGTDEISISGLESHLLMLFRALLEEQQDEVISVANRLYNAAYPGASVANPFSAQEVRARYAVEPKPSVERKRKP